LTCVSDGNPLRRLLIVSKAGLFVIVKLAHGTPPQIMLGVVKPNQRPRQELNLVFDLRRVACESGTLRGQNRREARGERREARGERREARGERLEARG
jgi:hypothetical protein